MKLFFISALLAFLMNAHAKSMPDQKRTHKVSWYGKGFHGKKTANGERYNMNALTAASNSHKFGTRLQVTNSRTGASVIVRVNDTGAFKKYGRTLDLSRAAFAKIAPLDQGICDCFIKIVAGSNK